MPWVGALATGLGATGCGAGVVGVGTILVIVPFTSFFCLLDDVGIRGGDVSASRYRLSTTAQVAPQIRPEMLLAKSEQEYARPLLTPAEVNQLSQGDGVLLVGGLLTCRAARSTTPSIVV